MTKREELIELLYSRFTTWSRPLIVRFVDLLLDAVEERFLGTDRAHTVERDLGWKEKTPGTDEGTGGSG